MDAKRMHVVTHDESSAPCSVFLTVTATHGGVDVRLRLLLCGYHLCRHGNKRRGGNARARLGRCVSVVCADLHAHVRALPSVLSPLPSTTSTEEWASVERGSRLAIPIFVDKAEQLARAPPHAMARCMRCWHKGTPYTAAHRQRPLHHGSSLRLGHVASKSTGHGAKPGSVLKRFSYQRPVRSRPPLVRLQEIVCRLRPRGSRLGRRTSGRQTWWAADWEHILQQ